MGLGGRSKDTFGSGQAFVADMEKCGGSGGDSSGNTSSEGGGGHRWCLIESDPGVFTELVEKLGVQGVAFEEVFGLDEGSFAMVQHRKPLHPEKGWKGSSTRHRGRGQLEGGGNDSGSGDQQQKVDVDMQDQQTHEEEEGVMQERCEESPEQDEKEEHLRKIFGFIFLFNWSKDKKTSASAKPHRSAASAAAGAAALARQQKTAKETSKNDGEGEAANASEGAKDKEKHGQKTVEQQQQNAADASSQSGNSCSYPEKLFFAKQVIPNACASQAILAVLINKRRDICDVGPTLSALVDFTQDFRDPYMRGEAIGNSDAIREAHNSFKGANPFDWAQDDDADEKEDAFHFVSYICFEGHAYEIDGLEDAPKCLGPCTEKNWTELVRQQLLHRVARIQEKASGELRFNLMAVVEDELFRIKKEIARQRLLAQRANVKRICLGEDFALEGEEVEDDNVDAADVPSMEQLPEDLEQLKEVVQQAKETKRLLELRELEELDVRARWKKENIRRRHDFVPFVLCILRHVARRGELVAAVEAAKEVAARRRQATREKQSSPRVASPAPSEKDSGKSS